MVKGCDPPKGAVPYGGAKGKALALLRVIANRRRWAALLAALALCGQAPASAEAPLSQPGSFPSSPEPGAEPGTKPPAHPLPRVLVIRRAGLLTYEQVTEEFRSRVRAAVRVLDTQETDRPSLLAWLPSFHPAAILAVGESANELTRGANPCPVISALVYDEPLPPGAAVSTGISPELALNAFRTARPGIRLVALLYGPRTASLVPAVITSAARAGVSVSAQSASSPQQAVSRLRALSGEVQGLWLLTDLALLEPQVFHYALVLQFRRRVPLLGATRRHAAQGALFSLDHSPQLVGERAAALVNHVLADGQPLITVPLRPELTVNLSTARRLGADLDGLRRVAAQMVQ